MNPTIAHLPAAMQRESQIAQMQSLSVACPVDQDNPCDCPFSNIRHLSLKARLKWVNTLSPEVMDGLQQFHVGCLRARHFQAELARRKRSG